MRESSTIPNELLQACIEDHYSISFGELNYLPLGLDYSAAVYRAKSVHGASYLIKVTSRLLYEARYLVPRYLYEQGITSVVAPIPTTSGKLWTKLSNWTIILYPFIEGESSFNGMTNEQWGKLGGIFKRIHEVPPSVGLTSLRQETFDTTEYARWVNTLNNLDVSLESVATSVRLLLTSWAEHRPIIHELLSSMKKLSKILQFRKVAFVICHADLHPANVIRNHAGNVYVIDWDEVMLAPKERDFIFVRQPYADAFFQTYVTANIDTQVLTYYRLERVVQDLIACGRNVCFRDDLEEESKERQAQLLQDILKDTSFLMELIHSSE